MKYIWPLVFFVLPLLGLSYVLWHVWHLLPLPLVWRRVVVGICLVLFFSLFVAFSGALERLPMSIASIIYTTGNSSIFVMLYLVMLFLMLDVASLVHIIPRAWLFNNGYMALGISLVMLAVFGYGNVHYNRKARVPVEVTTGKDASAKIVFLSDLHLGYHNHRGELKRWVDMINAEHPDLILIGGDICDISVRPLLEENMAEEFRRLNAPVYACLGNHEYYSGVSSSMQFYREAGITLLRDSVAKVDGLCIIGRDDRTNPRRRALETLIPEENDAKKSREFTILLDHQPHCLEEAEHVGIDLQLSGHTHHGQVWPVSMITDAIFEDAFGKLQKGNTLYYVTSGIGIWGGKFRIGTRSEYVVINIIPTPR